MKITWDSHSKATLHLGREESVSLRRLQTGESCIEVKVGHKYNALNSFLLIVDEVEFEFEEASDENEATV